VLVIALMIMRVFVSVITSILMPVLGISVMMVELMSAHP
jgi:hypothetical protein